MSRPQRGGRSVHAVLGIAAVVVALILAATAVLFVWSPTNRPGRANAILSLDGPDETARERVALSLARMGYAPVVLFSQGAYRSTACPSAAAITIVCFQPAPAHTIGEVAWATAYARRRGWDTLLVVAGRAQVTRARLLMHRCFAGHIMVVPADRPRDSLPFQVVHEWGATAKALLLDRHC